MKTKLGLTYLTTEVHDSQAMVALTSNKEYAFVWWGGPYVDVFIRTQLHACHSPVMIDGERFFVGNECVNVWDYAKGEPEIEWLDSDEFLYTINEWLGER